jgi:hypothetical protein
MNDLADVLGRATEGLVPDSPDLLLAGAVRRGAALRRRRRLARTGATVVGVAATGVVAALTLGRSGHVADPPAITEQPHSPTTVRVQATSPRIAIGRDQVGAVFAAILPGTITREHDTSPAHVPYPGGYMSSFDWNGYRVALQIVPLHRDAREACGRAIGDRGNEQSCVRVRGGWSVRDPHMDEANTNRWVSVYLDNGFRMWMLIYNSGDEKGSSAGGTPPLDVPALERVATSDRWFA